MKLSSWILATRPRTLSLSTMPVIVGGTLAWTVQEQLHWPALLAALLGGIFIHLGTNLHNDATGSKRGGCVLWGTGSRVSRADASSTFTVI